jgi:hypothetical protein
LKRWNWPTTSATSNKAFNCRRRAPAVPASRVQSFSWNLVVATLAGLDGVEERDLGRRLVAALATSASLASNT